MKVFFLIIIIHSYALTFGSANVSFFNSTKLANFSKELPLTTFESADGLPFFGGESSEYISLPQFDFYKPITLHGRKEILIALTPYFSLKYRLFSAIIKKETYKRWCVFLK